MTLFHQKYTQQKRKETKYGEQILFSYFSIKKIFIIEKAYENDEMCVKPIALICISLN